MTKRLYITDNNIHDLYNCDYSTIIRITIVSENTNQLLDNICKFSNLQILYLYNLTEIKRLDNLNQLIKLDLSYNKINEIKNIDSLINLQILALSNNQITEIKGLYKLANLKELHLSSNKITEIKSLENLVTLKELHLSSNKITEIKGLNKLESLEELHLCSNKITEIKGLVNLINLKILNLYNNKLTEITGLENLINLQILDLNNNEITEIKGLTKLASLEQLYLSNNKITKLKDISNLVNLQKIELYNNQLTEINEICNLISLQQIHLDNNEITELPLQLCNLRNINNIFYSNNPIEYIPLPVQRLLDRLNNKINVNNMVYDDKQNIHNHHIQNSFRTSLNNIFKDKQLLDLQTIKQQILENDILLEQTKREILNYCDDSNTMHTSLLITYSDLLIYVWSRIMKSNNKDDILQVLNQEISDGLCMCFTGRLTRLLNTLSGFYDDIELQISDSEQITNIIMALKNKFPDEQLIDAIRKELFDRQYNEFIINEWIDYI